MTQVTVVWWRDIPAQVIAGKGRRGGAKRQLPERFEQAIDRCAMKVGAKDSDAYLAEWRRAAPYEVEAESDAAAADAEAARLDAEYDAERIKALIANDGWAAATA
ncbi:virulence factor [Albimonas sp. CAU 1670]|uniref:virulence factor n=1 Tax=Albimonas sp. CAU 1670 TaxID=3032599 RepID=UPI0023D99041|nr:virulence factor [Albimonas sp. CAU 1670]MDF2232076.1 virulence factor [Albimonas sp. CAU 1670]